MMGHVYLGRSCWTYGSKSHVRASCLLTAPVNHTCLVLPAAATRDALERL